MAHRTQLVRSGDIYQTVVVAVYFDKTDLLVQTRDIKAVAERSALRALFYDHIQNRVADGVQCNRWGGNTAFHSDDLGIGGGFINHDIGLGCKRLGDEA